MLGKTIWYYSAVPPFGRRHHSPASVDVPITARGRITAPTEQGGEFRYEREVWRDDPEGVKLTVGDAAVVFAEIAEG